MPLRAFTEFEKRNLARLTSLSIDATVMQPTRTGLGKAILDATAPVRNYLREHGLHDYDEQGSGAREHGAELESKLVSIAAVSDSRTSLYRPKAKGKGGDPRIWFSGLPDFADPDDLIALIADGSGLIGINITQSDLGDVLDQEIRGPLHEWLDHLSGAAKETSNELLGKLRRLAAQGALKSIMEAPADTAIGRTLETALGIQINSRKEPDYNGIELKAFRRAASKSRENRKTLFAKVANWKESKFKSSGEILDAFGYQRDEDFKLYCTVSATTRNSQGLSFEIDDLNGHLNERSQQNNVGVFATWLMKDLRAALAAKHNETFWVSARAHDVNGHEHFELQNVLHTKSPILSQFDLLLLQGDITMDHLIKRNAKGRVSEKGPLFKINSQSLPLLFPPSVSYDLQETQY